MFRDDFYSRIYVETDQTFTSFVFDFFLRNGGNLGFYKNII